MPSVNMETRESMLPPNDLQGGLSVAILAGGKSSRMGRDKRFIHLAERSLLDRAVDLAHAILGESPGRVLLCGDVPGRECVRDAYPGLGPVGGIFSAVTNVRRSVRESAISLLVIPVDMPLLTHAFLSPLLETLRDTPAARAVRYAEFEMPFVIRCDLRASETLRVMCEGQDEHLRSVRLFLSQMEALEIPFPMEMRRIMVNVNSPSDFAFIQGGGENHEYTAR